MADDSRLIFKDTIYVSNQTDQSELFKEIADQLLAQDLVTDDFLTNLMAREENHPTGLSMEPINKKYPNIAIPHTDSQYVKTSRIVPVKLTQPVPFKDMINSASEIPVSYLFMILNDKGEAQTEVLAQIMDFVNSTEEVELLKFFETTDIDQIFEFLENRF